MVAIFALTGVAHAQTKIDPNNLIYPIGEGKFNWGQLPRLRESPRLFWPANSRSPHGGQEASGKKVKICGAYFAKATGADVPPHRLANLQARCGG